MGPDRGVGNGSEGDGTAGDESAGDGATGNGATGDGAMGSEVANHGDPGGDGSSDDPVVRARGDWGRERPELDTSSMEIFGRLLRAQRLAETRLAAVVDQYGLNLSAFDILASLRRGGPPFRRTPTELAASSMLTTGGVTFRLERLEAAGLIRRVRSERDRRVLWAVLTDQGRAIIDRAIEDLLDHEHALLATLETDEIDRARRSLQRLITALQAAQPAASAASGREPST